VQVPSSDLVADTLSLLDWKRRVFELYQRVRGASDPVEAWSWWRQERDDLFGTHPQTPLPRERLATFRGLAYYDYDPAMRVPARLEPAAEDVVRLPTAGVEEITFRRIGTAVFELAGAEQGLDAYWLEGYGGGLFLPVADATCGEETYGGGRYILDTVKGSDLGTNGDGIRLDFNFAYNPSCSYDDRWVCPLAPPGNRLPLAIRAGERFDSP
jgi:uncharacterized protein (DUF1684 family)